MAPYTRGKFGYASLSVIEGQLCSLDFPFTKVLDMNIMDQIQPWSKQPQCPVVTAPTYTKAEIGQSTWFIVMLWMMLSL